MDAHTKFISLTLRSDQLHVLVIGGGNVALRKVNTLVGKVKSITVVAPEILKEIEDLPSVVCCKREYQKKDLEGVQLLYSAVDKKTVTEKIYTDLREYPSILSNFVDKPEYGDFYTPCTLQKDDLIISLSSGGKAPGLLPEFKNEIENKIDIDNWNKQIIQYEQKRREDNVRI